MELRPYQEEAVKSIFNEWETNNSTLLILPTGCGKTIVCAELIRKILEQNKKVLFLAHRSELLEQAQNKFAIFRINASIEKAENHANIGIDNVIIASIQSISRDNRLNNYPTNYFDYVIIDEAHHSAADTYLKVIEYFKNAKLLGVTATPNRADVRNIADIFESVAYSYNIKDAIDDKYLSSIKIKRIPLKIDISNVHLSCGDYQVGELGETLLPYLEDIANHLKNKAENRKTLIFTPTIAIGEEFASLLKTKGFRAACVSSKNTPEERKDIINQLHTGELNVVTNALLLTEGFDEPSVDCIINLRATKSESLFTQIVGRGLRLSPETNKEDLLYLDFLWQTGKNGYDILSPINLFIDKSRLPYANEILNNGETEDIFSLQEKADARFSLAEKLKNASKRYFCGKEFKENFNPNIEYRYNDQELDSLIIKNDEVIEFYTGERNYEYIPYHKWEIDPVTEKQRELLKNLGFETINIKYKGLAARLLNLAFLNKELDRCSYKQYNFLKKKGFKNIKKWKKDEVANMMQRIADNNWKIPYNVKPMTYLPPSLKQSHF